MNAEEKYLHMPSIPATTTTTTTMTNDEPRQHCNNRSICFADIDLESADAELARVVDEINV